MTNWFQDNQAQTELPIDDRGFQYGDGLFETIAIRNEQPRLWSYHLDRLERGCERLGIEMPQRDVLLNLLRGALRCSDVPMQYCVAKMILSAGTGTRGYGRATAITPSIFIGVFPATPPAVRNYCDGIDVFLCKTRLAGNSAAARLKTLNRLEQVIASSEFSDSDFFEGFTMDAGDNIICGTMSNVFFVTGGIISTPPLDHCGVEGVMRRHIFAILQEHDIDVRLCDQSADRLADVDEVFMANSQFGLLPVRSCDGVTWVKGEVTRQVMALMLDSGIVECQS